MLDVSLPMAGDALLRFARRRGISGCLALAVALLLLSLPRPAAAHHGWSSYDTTQPLFFTGSLEQVSWQNPHAEVQLSMPAGVALPTNLADLPIPQEFEVWGGREVLRSTGVLSPSAEAWTLVLAPLARLQAWGVSEPPAVGETISGVGYLSRVTPGELRIELVILGDGRAVWLREAPQAGSAGAPVVTLELPPTEAAATPTAVAPAASATAAPTAAASTATAAPAATVAATPLPTTAPAATAVAGEPAGGAAPGQAPSAQGGAGSGWLWGAGLLALLAGGAVLFWLRRRAAS